MEFLWFGIGVVVVLLVRGRLDRHPAARAGRPIRGMDAKASLDARRAAQAEIRTCAPTTRTDGGGF